MNPEYMAESDHRITRPAFPDYRELFRESDIKSVVAFFNISFPFKFVIAFSFKGKSDSETICDGWR